MRTKTLLIASAALAAGILTSSAQTYSQNIVGYVSQTLPYNGNNGWAAVCVPLDFAAGNTLTNLFPNPGPGGGSNPLDYDLVYIWNGAGYSIYTIDSDYPSGVANSADNAGVASPAVTPGSLIFINNAGGNAPALTTNVLAGTVHVDTAPTGAQTVGTTTQVLLPGFNYVASKLPVGGGISSVLQLTNPGPGSGGNVLDYSLVYVPNIVNGNFTGYQIVTIDSDYASGFANAADNAQALEPQIPVGAGFIIDFVDNNSVGSYTWTQQY
jgi:hypothetical protein